MKNVPFTRGYGAFFDMVRYLSLTFFAFIVTCTCVAQNVEWLLYARTIRDSKGNYRFDQNVVPNFRLNKLLRLELGIRHGENSRAFDAYYHYKVELQTKSFWNTLRFVARMSDNVWKSPTIYSRSNYLTIAESRFAVSPKISLLIAAGGVAQYQKNDVRDATPLFQGSRKFFPTYRFTFRYHVNERWFVDAVYGAYDTFNPYPANAPFLQVDSEYEITKHLLLYGYLRYQYNHQVDVALNDFLGLGIRLK